MGSQGGGEGLLHPWGTPHLLLASTHPTLVSCVRYRYSTFPMKCAKNHKLVPKPHDNPFGAGSVRNNSKTADTGLANEHRTQLANLLLNLARGHENRSRVVSRVAQSVQWLATVWTTRRSRFDPQQRRKDFSSSLCVQTGSGAHPASSTMGTGGPFPRGKGRSGRDDDQ
jgi:hypothetical protein